MPFFRSSTPSSTVATARKSIPQDSSSFAQFTAPCPYASAFTEAQTFIFSPTVFFISKKLWRKSARLIISFVHLIRIML